MSMGRTNLFLSIPIPPFCHFRLAPSPHAKAAFALWGMDRDLVVVLKSGTRKVYS